MTRARFHLESVAVIADPIRFDHRPEAAVLSDDPADQNPEALYLVIDCPHCDGAALYPGERPDGSHRMARCPGCEAIFGFDILDVYVAASPNG